MVHELAVQRLLAQLFKTAGSTSTGERRVTEEPCKSKPPAAACSVAVVGARWNRAQLERRACSSVRDLGSCWVSDYNYDFAHYQRCVAFLHNSHILSQAFFNCLHYKDVIFGSISQFMSRKIWSRRRRLQTKCTSFTSLSAYSYPFFTSFPFIFHPFYPSPLSLLFLPQPAPTSWPTPASSAACLPLFTTSGAPTALSGTSEALRRSGRVSALTLQSNSCAGNNSANGPGSRAFEDNPSKVCLKYLRGSLVQLHCIGVSLDFYYA